MAACLTHVPILLFLFGVAFPTSQLHVQGRELKFFSKVTNHFSVTSKTGVPKDSLGVRVLAPELAPGPALSPVSAAGDELVYHSGSSGIPSAPEMDSVDEFEGKVSGEELLGESLSRGYGYGDAISSNLNFDRAVNARPSGGFSSGNAYQVEAGAR